jgi:hypothetical protein
LTNELGPALEWKDDDVVVKAGSTRPVTLSTGEVVRFAPEALADIADQIATKFIPMNVEHLGMLPPVGRWHEGEIVTAEDGAEELLLRGRLLPRRVPVGLDPNVWAFLEELDPARELAPGTVEIDHVALEPRNFDERHLEAAKQSSPLPIREETRWSELPPLEWVFAIPVIWGLARFTGSFLDTLGRETAQALIHWVGDLASEAKDGDRDRILSLRFVLPDESLVYGYILVPADADLDLEAIPALEAAGRLAEIAGAQAEKAILGDARLTAFLWSGGQWNFAWAAFDEDVRVTRWFLANTPDPSRFLGRPLFPDED